MKVAVHLFARARDLAGQGTVQVELASGGTVGDLRRILKEVLPIIGQVLDHSAFAVNNEFADDHRIIPDGAEVALVPPVSGG